MKTISISIENLCVPCHCGCRHCLLDSCHKATGVDYARGQAFARRFYSWMRENRPDLGGNFYVGYCNEFAELGEHISFVREFAPWFDFLQFNGLAFRNGEEIRALLGSVMERGVRLIDLTFFGLEEFHDRFAGRKGDFRYLLEIAGEAKALGLPRIASVCLTEENKGQMDALFGILREHGIERYTVFLPHAKGRGEKLAYLRLTQESFDALPQIVRNNFMRVPHKTEAQWLREGNFPRAERRALTLALTPENIDRLEAMDPAEIIRELEEMDDAYYSAIPSMEKLARLCGKPENRQLFRFRDLALEWQKRYIRERKPDIYDMNDERHSFSVHLYPNARQEESK